MNTMRICSAAILFLISTALRGQSDRQELDFDRPESWGMKYFASVELLNGFGPPQQTEWMDMDLAVEVSHVPYLKKSYRRIGFFGTKVENMNKAPVLVRPRITVGLLERLSATISYVPPIEVFDNLETHLVGASVNYLVHAGERWQVGLRLIGQWNDVRGDFTCPEEAVNAGLDDPERNPFQCEEVSNDNFEALTYSTELSVGYAPEFMKGGRFFAAIMYNWMDLEFQVNAFYGGSEDNRQLATDGETVSYSGGISLPLTERLGADLAFFYAPLDVQRSRDASIENDSLAHVRAQLTYAF